MVSEESVAEWITRWRKHHNLIQKDVAAHIGTTSRYLDISSRSADAELQDNLEAITMKLES